MLSETPWCLQMYLIVLIANHIPLQKLGSLFGTQLVVSNISPFSPFSQGAMWRVCIIRLGKGLLSNCHSSGISTPRICTPLHLGRRFRKPPFSWVKVSVFHRVSVDDRRKRIQKYAFFKRKPISVDLVWIRGVWVWVLETVISVLFLFGVEMMKWRCLLGQHYLWTVFLIKD